VIDGAGQTLLQTLNTVLDDPKLEDGPPRVRTVPVVSSPSLVSRERNRGGRRGGA